MRADSLAKTKPPHSDKQEVSQHIPEEVKKLFRLFEMEIRCGGNSIFYRVITSANAEDILSLGEPGLFFAVLHLFSILNNDCSELCDENLEAWCIVLSFFAERLGDETAPQESDDLGDWFMWAAGRFQLGFSDEDHDSEEENIDAAK